MTIGLDKPEGPSQDTGRLNLFSAIRPITRAGAMRDIMAGVTLASLSIPQVLGYTRIAGTPVITGLYTAILPVIVFALLGSSRHLVVAADSSTAAIFSASLSQLATPESAHYMALVMMVALLTGGLLLLARLFKLGFLADFLSRTVLIGFLTGVGFQVGIAVFGQALGLPIESHSTLGQLREIVMALPTAHLPTLALSSFVVASILLGKRLMPKVPVALVVVIGSIVASASFGFAAHGISVIGPISGGLPSISLPDVTWHESLGLLPVAASCFVMIIAQSASTSRAFGAKHHEHVDENADILGLAAANATAALSGAFVVNGSPTQTAIADGAGGRSQLTQLTFAAIVIVVVLALTGPLQYLPHCVLASVVLTIAVGLVDVEGLRDIQRASSGEFRLAVLTAVAVVTIGLEQGVLIAITLSLLRHVQQSYRPHTSIITIDADGRREPAPATPGSQTAPGLIIYNFGADLFYANAEGFTQEIGALVAHAPTPVRWLVIDASAVTGIDYSAARALRDMIEDINQREVTLIFARASTALRSDLDRHDLTSAIGEAHVFGTMHEALQETLIGTEPQG